MKNILLLFVAACMVGCIYTRDTKDEFNKGASATMIFIKVSEYLALPTNAADIAFKVDLYMRTTDPALKDSIRDYLLWEYRIEYYSGTFTLKGAEREWIIHTNGKALGLDAFWTIDYGGPYGMLSRELCQVRKSGVKEGAIDVIISHDTNGEYADNSSTLQIERVEPLEVLFRPNGDYLVQGSGQLITDVRRYHSNDLTIEFQAESPLLCGITSDVNNPYAGVTLRNGRLRCDVSATYFKNDELYLNVYTIGDIVYADANTNGVEVKNINMSSFFSRY